MPSELITQEFLSQTRGRVPFTFVLEDILAETLHGTPLRISVGTDSEDIGLVTKYVTLIHVWRVGRGARAYRVETFEDIRDGERSNSRSRFRQRIWREILLTAMLAQELRSALRDAFSSSLCDAIEVHADVGENGKSSTMIREVIGMLKGYGFPDEFIKLKPEAYAASAVADHYI